MRLSNFINKFIFTIVFISTALAFLVSIFFQYSNFEKDKVYMKADCIEQKKKDLKKEINIIFDLIEQEEKTLEKVQDKFRNASDFQKIQNDNKEQILNWLSSYKTNEGGYIFVNTLDNKAIIYDGKKLENPILHPDQELYKELLEAASMPDGDFVFYDFKKLESSEEFEKIGYVKVYEKYNWFIGTGIYLDDMREEILRKEAIFKNSIQTQLQYMFFVFVFLLFAVYITTKRLSRYIKTNIKNLTVSFEKAARQNEKINTNNLTFKEFVSLANNLNITLENKNYLEKELQDYIKLVDEHIIISSINKKGIITEANEAFCKITAYSKEELIGNTHQLIRHPDTPDSFYDEMWEALRIKKEWKGEIKNIDKNGKDYWVQAIIKSVYKNNKLIGFRALRTNITDKKRVEELSITDEQTQLYNRRFFNAKIEEELNRAKRENNYLSLLILDVDYFKEYNDTYGHQKGDEALEKIATILKKHTNRSSDFAFRLGGEEFGIITNLDNFKIIEFAQNIRIEIEKLNIEHKSSKISNCLTISIGISSKEGNDIETSTILYKQADDALYKSKENGRNCISIQN